MTESSHRRKERHTGGQGKRKAQTPPPSMPSEEAAHMSTHSKQPQQDANRHEIVADMFEMLNTIGHELLSPLASLLGYTETLLRVEDQLTPAERREFLVEVWRTTMFRQR